MKFSRVFAKRVLRYILLFAIGGYWTSAHAVDFYWAYNGLDVNHFSNAVSACKYIVRVASATRYVATVITPDGNAADCWAEDDVIPAHPGWMVIKFGDQCPANTIYNKITGACDSNSSNGQGVPPKFACAGDPINLLNGNVFEEELDFRSGISSLTFSRFYNSLDGVWRHNYSTRVDISGEQLIRTTAQGQTFVYTVSGSAVTAQSTDYGKLSKTLDGWVYATENNEVDMFDTSGRLTQRITAGSQKQKISYSGISVAVTDESGESLSFTEDSKHQPSNFSVPGVNIQYTYDANERLTRLARIYGNYSENRQFHYEDARNAALLTGITDGRGVRSTIWTYDDQGRGTSSQHAGGAELTQIVYNADGTRKVTNELGKSTLYRFVEVAGTQRVSAIEGEPSANCPESNSTYTYNDRGQVLTQTDAKGFVTTHTYNDRGLETSRTEATGTPQARTTTTIWHATFNLPLTVIQPGQKTTYTYDAQGRQTSRTQSAL